MISWWSLQGKTLHFISIFVLFPFIILFFSSPWAWVCMLRQIIFIAGRISLLQTVIVSCSNKAIWLTWVHRQRDRTNSWLWHWSIPTLKAPTLESKESSGTTLCLIKVSDHPSLILTPWSAVAPASCAHKHWDLAAATMTFLCSLRRRKAGKLFSSRHALICVWLFVLNYMEERLAGILKIEAE